jgi:thiol-disulfide isomerase/thioredoxin
MNKNIFIVLAVVIVLILAALYFPTNLVEYDDNGNRIEKDPEIIPGTQIEEKSNNNQEESWRNIALQDVNTGEQFTISQFEDKPILLESFAVWCPTCTAQQRKIKELHDEIGDQAVSISLDTDSNEDEERVRAHTQKNGFDWYYAVSPIELTQALIDDFGSSIVNAPSVPMILLCPNKTPEKLPNGQKSVQELKDFINSC